MLMATCSLNMLMAYVVSLKSQYILRWQKCTANGSPTLLVFIENSNVPEAIAICRGLVIVVTSRRYWLLITYVLIHKRPELLQDSHIQQDWPSDEEQSSHDVIPPGWPTAYYWFEHPPKSNCTTMSKISEMSVFGRKNEVLTFLFPRCHVIISPQTHAGA